MSIGSYIISPFVNNRQLNTACGLGNHDTTNTFLISSYTSGDPLTVGLCVQGAGGADLDSGAPIDTVQIWINFLRSTMDFILDVPKLILNSNIETTGQIIMTDLGNSRKTTLAPNQIEVRNTENDPLGDPIYTLIEPNNISMANGTGPRQTVSMTVGNINLTNEDTQFINDIAANNITIRDFSETQVGTFSNSQVSLNNDNLGLNTTMTAGAITATNWSIDNTGLGTFNTITVNSISTVSTVPLTATALNINLDGYAISGSYSITINNNVTIFNPTFGITGGVYKLWLTVGPIPRTFTKACGVINNLLGDTLMAAGSIWLITIYKRSSGTYRATFDNFT